MSIIDSEICYNLDKEKGDPKISFAVRFKSGDKIIVLANAYSITRSKVIYLAAFFIFCCGYRYMLAMLTQKYQTIALTRWSRIRSSD